MNVGQPRLMAVIRTRWERAGCSHVARDPLIF
jgi:hypothetical protein